MNNLSTPSSPPNSKGTKVTSSENSSLKSCASSSDSTKQAAKEKKKISRLRTGCWTCRRRGYKCDEGKPFCHNCIRLNLQCEGYGIRLKWQDDSYFRQHNKAKGRENLGSSDNVSKPTPSLNLPRSRSSKSTNVSKDSRGGSSGSGSEVVLSKPQSQATSYSIPTNADQIQSSTTPLSSDLRNSFVDLHNQVSPAPVSFHPQPNLSKFPHQPLPHSQQNLQQQYTHQQFYHTQEPTHHYFQTPDPISQHIASKPVNVQVLTKNAFMPTEQTHHAYPIQSLPIQIHQQPIAPNQQQLNVQPQFLHSTDSGNLLATCIQRFSDHYVNFNIHGQGACKFSKLVLECSKFYGPLAFAIGNLGSKGLPIAQPELTELFVDFKIKALCFLRQDLVYRGISEPSLLCMLILGIIEMNEFNHKAWNQHLEGAANGITEILQANPTIMENLENYPKFVTILETMVRLDIMYAITITSKPRLYKVYRSYQEKIRYTGLGIPEVPSVSSLSAPIFMAVSDILCLASDLHKQFPRTTFELEAKYPEYYAVSKAHYTTYFHQRYDLVLKDIENSCNVEGNDTNLLCTLGLTKKQVILLYFKLRLDDDEFQTQLSSDIRKIRDQGLKLLSQESLDFLSLQSHAVVIWLLGITAETKTDRDKLLAETTRRYNSTPRPTFHSVQHFLNVFWRKRDSPEYKDYTYRNLLSITTEEINFKLTF